MGDRLKTLSSVKLRFSVVWLLPLHPPPSSLCNPLFLLCCCESGCFRFPEQVRSYGICLSVPDYFTQSKALQLHPCGHKWQNFLSHQDKAVFHCVSIPHFPHRPSCWWTPRFLPQLGCCEQCGSGSGGMDSVWQWFQIFGVNTQKWDCCIIW